MNDLISVIVPVYNVKEYIERCIKSILRQSYQNIEIIIVNDGSTDGSGELCDKIALTDKHIRVVHKKNGGSSSARNCGLKYAQGEYIGFVDSDDYISENMYELLIGHMAADVDIVCCGRKCLNRGNGKKYYNAYCMRGIHKFSRIEAIKLLFGEKISFSVCTKLFRKDLFKDIRFPLGRVCEDLPTVYRLFSQSRNIVHIGGEPQYYNYYRQSSVSNKPFYMRRIDCVLFSRDILLDVQNNYPELKERAEAMYIMNIIGTITDIKNTKKRMEYKRIEKRLKRLLRRMTFAGLHNLYVGERQKTMLIRNFFHME